MSTPEVDHAAASRRRAAGPAQRLEVADVVESVAYDIVGEHHGRWAQVRAGITTLAELRAEVGAFTTGNPAVTWHIIARTTTTTETLADHLLDDARAGASTANPAPTPGTAHEEATLW